MWQHAADLTLIQQFVHNPSLSSPKAAALRRRGLNSNAGVQDMFKEELPGPSMTASIDSLQTSPPQPLDVSISDRSTEDGVGAIQVNSASSALIVQPQAQMLPATPAVSSGPVTERACALVS